MLLYVGRAEGRSGPWLWALDVESRNASSDCGPRALHVRLRKPGRYSCWSPPARANSGATATTVQRRHRGPRRTAVSRLGRASPAAALRWHVAVLPVGLDPRTGDGLGQRTGRSSRRRAPRAPRVRRWKPCCCGRQAAREKKPRGHVEMTNSRTLAASIEIQGVAGQAQRLVAHGTRDCRGWQRRAGSGLVHHPTAACRTMSRKVAFNPV